jgi:hypothetical protein
MIKSELINLIASKQTHLSIIDVDAAVHCIIDINDNGTR